MRAALAPPLFALFLALAAAASPVLRPASGAELDAIVEDPSRAAVVAFTAPGATCEACPALRGELEALAAGAGASVAVVEFDAGADRAAADHARGAYGVRALPTVLLRAAGEDAPLEPYRGERTAGAILRRLGPVRDEL